MHVIVRPTFVRTAVLCTLCSVLTLPSFCADAISYVCLLLLHSYMSLQAFQSTVQGYELLLVIWFIAIGVDELRQV